MKTLKIILICTLAMFLLMSAIPTLVTAEDGPHSASNDKGRGSPDHIYIDPNAENPENRVTIIFTDADINPPQIWMKRNGVWTQI